MGGMLWRLLLIIELACLLLSSPLSTEERNLQHALL